MTAFHLFVTVITKLQLQPCLIYLIFVKMVDLKWNRGFKPIL